MDVKPAAPLRLDNAVVCRYLSKNPYAVFSFGAEQNVDQIADRNVEEVRPSDWILANS